MDAPAHNQNGKTTIGIDLGSSGSNALQPLIRLLHTTADQLTTPLLHIHADAQMGDEY